MSLRAIGSGYARPFELSGVRAFAEPPSVAASPADDFHAAGAGPIPAITRGVQRTILHERARTQSELLDFSKEHRDEAARLTDGAERRRLDRNAEQVKKSWALASEIERVAEDPKLSAKAKQKKLKKLRERLDAEVRRIRPAFSLENVTTAIQQIMDDGSLSAKEKRNRVDELRKDYGLSKSQMKRLFTKRMGGIYKASRNRIGALKKEIEREGKARLAEVERRFGKKSPEAAAVKADLESAKRLQQSEWQALDQKQKVLNKMYPSFWQRLGNFFKRAFGFLGKALSWIALPLKFIPGVGTVASAIAGGLGAAFSFAGGNWKEGVAGLISAIPIPGTKAIGAALFGGIGRRLSGAAAELGIRQVGGAIFESKTSGTLFRGAVKLGSAAKAVAPMADEGAKVAAELRAEVMARRAGKGRA
jgi:hypothetical protein